MKWLAAALAALAVFVLMTPDPLVRLERISGAQREQETGKRIREYLARLLGQQRQDSAERKAAIHALAALAAELRAGTPQNRALEMTGEKVWPSACGAVRFDGDIAEALRHDARRMPLITPLAACWFVAAQHGGGLSAAVTKMAEQARVAEDIRVQLVAQMAGPRATARILMMLPIFGIAMGMMMGVNPLAWLLGTPLGLGCLVAGIGLVALGYWWTWRIVQRVESLL